MYTARITFLLLIYKLVVVIASEPLNPLSDTFIDLINKEGKWKAGRNFHPDTPMSYIKELLGTNLQESHKHLPIVQHDRESIENLPESFDPRVNWPNCPSLNEIRDQGRCGACWAFGVVEAITDRVCIHSNGTENFHFSAEDLLACDEDSHGCYGGSPYQAWEEWVDEGLVSGGNYNSHQGCKPYTIPECFNHAKNCTKYLATPPCVRSCEPGYNLTYEQDKRRGKSVYTIDGEQNIMAELFANGPVSANFVVFEDFADYKGGVYDHLKGEFLGGHCVKMMGWGVENGTKYWLLANSWNTDFGEKGFFKMLRGVDECAIESFIFAGQPLLDDY